MLCRRTCCHNATVLYCSLKNMRDLRISALTFFWRRPATAHFHSITCLHLRLRCRDLDRAAARRVCQILTISNARSSLIPSSLLSLREALDLAIALSADSLILTVICRCPAADDSKGARRWETHTPMNEFSYLYYLQLQHSFLHLASV